MPSFQDRLVIYLTAGKNFPDAIGKCLGYFLGVDRTVEGYEGLIAAQDCLVGNEKKDAFAAHSSMCLKCFWPK